MPFGGGWPPAVTVPARVLDGWPVGTQPRGVFQPYRKGLPPEGSCRWRRAEWWKMGLSGRGTSPGGGDKERRMYVGVARIDVEVVPT